MSVTTNPPGSTQLPDGCVITDAAPVYDQGRGRWVPATCGHAHDDAPDHIAARAGQAGHQRSR